MTTDFSKGSPTKLILSFAVPYLIGNLFQLFYNIADTVIVGQILGVRALAAVGTTSSLVFLHMVRFSRLQPVFRRWLHKSSVQKTKPL